MATRDKVSKHAENVDLLAMLQFEEEFNDAECFLKTNEFMKTLDFNTLFDNFKYALMSGENCDVNLASESQENLNLFLLL